MPFHEDLIRSRKHAVGEQSLRTIPRATRATWKRDRANTAWSQNSRCPLHKPASRYICKKTRSAKRDRARCLQKMVFVGVEGRMASSGVILQRRLPRRSVLEIGCLGKFMWSFFVIDMLVAGESIFRKTAMHHQEEGKNRRRPAKL